MKSIKCSLCNKRFGSAHSLGQHATQFHKKRAAEVVAVKVEPCDDDEYESEADRQIERDVAAYARSEGWK